MALLQDVFVADAVPQFSTEDHNLAVALDLAQAGAYVFPCIAEGEKRKWPASSQSWKIISTRDPAEVRKLWRRYPGSVPGIDLAKSGLIVVDCDAPKNMSARHGKDWLIDYAVKFADDLSYPAQVDTPSGGKHYYFLNPDKHGNGRGTLPPKTECPIDLRGHGGYVIGPDACFLDGGCYEPLGSIFDATPMPEWLVDILKPRAATPAPIFVPPSRRSQGARLEAYGDEAISQIASELASVPEGSRNEEANRLGFRAGQLVGGGCLTESEAYSVLSQAALAWGISPRDKALGPKGTIARAIKAGMASPAGPKNEPIDARPPISIDEFLAKLPSVKKPAPAEMPDALLHPPGLVGEIADYITRTALFPQPALSLGAALTIVGTAAGRQIAGPRKCGTHLYVVALAPSGAGKNHPLMQIGAVLSAAGLQHHVGPGQFMSMPAVISLLNREPLSVCPMDEFGSFLKRIHSRRASGFEGAITGILRQSWGASFGVMSTAEYAQRAGTPIHSPALSIYGVSTPREFYEALDGADVTNGVLNRFLVIESKTRPLEQIPSDEPVPPGIVDGLKAIYAAGPLKMLNQATVAPAYRVLDISPDAEQIRRGLVADVRQWGDDDRKLEPFLARTAENALRMASIATIGRGVDCIESDVMSWAREFSVFCTHTLAEGAGLYIADSETQAMAQTVRRTIIEAGGRITKRNLWRTLAHRYKDRDLEDILKSGERAGWLAIDTVKPEGRGRPSVWISISNGDE